MKYVQIIPAFLLLVLAACQSSPPPQGVKVGKPYSIDGVTYYPEIDEDYDRTGMASWYGPGFHGKNTANGEEFNQNDLTAAHPTLPMPSIVRVTNLQSGKSLILRINDRGPFKRNRIIDLSKRASQELGIPSTARVRVQYLPQETEEYRDSVRAGRPISMAEFNSRPARARIAETAVAATEQETQESVSSAPVMTVSSNDIAATDAPARPVVLQQDESMPPRLVKDAWADDNVSFPEAPQQATEVGADQAPAPVEQMNDLAPSVASAPTTQPIIRNDTAQYLVQAGAFSSEENAKKLVAKLNDIGTPIIEYVSSGGKMWWRVRVGPYVGRSAADDALGKVKSSGAPQAHLVRM